MVNSAEMSPLTLAISRGTVIVAPENTVRLARKTVGLVDAYRDAFTQVPPDQRWSVNENLNDFFVGYAMALEAVAKNGRQWSRNQIIRLGTLRAGRPGPNSKFIGIPCRERRNYRQHLRDLMNERKEEPSIESLHTEIELDEAYPFTEDRLEAHAISATTPNAPVP